MEATENETTAEEIIEEETPETELSAETDWEAEAKKARGIAQRLRTKLTKATEKKVEKVEPKVEPVKETQKTGELDETALDYLDLKGITDQEDIDLIQSVVKKTGQTVRQVLKDDYVSAKLTSNKEAREVKAATPSSTKRSSNGQSNDLTVALAAFEKTGELPADFELATAVTNAALKRNDPSIPPWRRG